MSQQNDDMGMVVYGVLIAVLMYMVFEMYKDYTEDHSNEYDGIREGLTRAQRRAKRIARRAGRRAARTDWRARRKARSTNGRKAAAEAEMNAAKADLDHKKEYYDGVAYDKNSSDDELFDAYNAYDDAKRAHSLAVSAYNVYGV
jgi:hypothetical protein